AALAEPVIANELTTDVTATRQLVLEVATVNTWHIASPLVQHDLDSTDHVSPEARRKVEYEQLTALAKVQRLVQWGDDSDDAAELGLACLHGSSPDVGVGGYLLGGGIFLYARRLGMATSSLTAVEVVLADGQLVRADRTQHQSLFWALRGGGGSF